MSVDVVTQTEIGRPRDEVAAFAADPGNAVRWYENIESVEWETPPPLAVGSTLAAAPLMARAMRRANLPARKALLES